MARSIREADMRRIATSFIGVALVAFQIACSADAPAPTPPGQGPGPNPTPGASPLQIRLFTSNPNPIAGGCTLIQAVVSLNGSNVPDGTGVQFSTNFGTFQQDSGPTVSVPTQDGAAVTALCSPATGLSAVHATATVGSTTGSGTILIAFQSSSQQAPFFTTCSPSLGPNTGGTSLTLNGGRFFGDATTTRVTFMVAGITREGVVTAVTPNAVTVTTPAFPEAVAPTVPVTINLTLGTNSVNPTTLTVPNCFVYGTAAGGTATITAVLPSSGSKAGNTRVTIVGSGFSAPVQVFFGAQEANVLSVSFNQIIVLSPGLVPPATPGAVDVRVHEVLSGQDAVLAGSFRYVQPLAITSAQNTQQRVDQPFSQVTIFGGGFEAPVAVSLAGIPAAVISVSATEVIVLPGTPFVSDCNDVTGPIGVTKINTGETATGADFHYLITQTAPSFRGVSPATASAGTLVTVSGIGFSTVSSITVGGKTVSASFDPGTQTINFSAPDFTNGTPPKCVAPNPAGTQTPVGGPVDITVRTIFGCAATASGAFQPTAACVP
jgi:hypothetical protein